MRICKGWQCKIEFEPKDRRQLYHDRACLMRTAKLRYRRKARRAIRLMEGK